MILQALTHYYEDLLEAGKNWPPRMEPGQGVLWA